MSKKKNSANTSFIFNIAHKMLTPLNAMTEFTNMLENNLEDEQQARDCIKKIKASHEFMRTLINNILETARLESGIATVEEAYGNVNVLMKSVAKEFQGLMKKKNIQFSTEIDVKHPDIMVDFTKVKGILLNLISNAHKYTPEGGKIKNWTMTSQIIPFIRPPFQIRVTAFPKMFCHLFLMLSPPTVQHHRQEPSALVWACTSLKSW